MSLYDYVTIKRRYTRSVNLERDLQIADSVNGYILTPKSTELVGRFLEALTSPNTVRAWTLTGVYGTGKSAFAHFLAALCSSKDDKIRSNAVHILKQENSIAAKTLNKLNNSGLVKAVATAQREPVAHTLVRALSNASKYWDGVRGVKPGVLADIEIAYNAISKGKHLDSKHVVSLIHDFSHAAKSGLLIIIDELGKNLEYAAQSQSDNDLYILQQIAELPTGVNDPRIFFIGLLHQAFYEYSNGLASVSRSEWAKIQGRFENIPLSESSDRILHIIKNAIEYKNDQQLSSYIRKWSTRWVNELQGQEIISRNAIKNLSAIYPFHPIAAVSLPILCNKFSQNDRTLFTFLSSDEPHSFVSFLKQNHFATEGLTTLKIDQLYDYFVESAGAASSSRPQYQRWLEIQGRISEARSLMPDAVRVLKVIGVLNLISNTGPLKASKKLVVYCLSDSPDDNKPRYWNDIIDELIKKGFITASKRDELRIWEGSDFDIEQALSDQVQSERFSLSELLSKYYPLNPIIPRRYNYECGIVRYFERKYLDFLPDNPACLENDSDGIAFYLVSDNKLPSTVPAFTSDNRPIAVIVGQDIEALKTACYEYAALKNVLDKSKQLQSDGVARREVRQRLFESVRRLEEAIYHSFTFENVRCWIAGKKEHINSEKDFNSKLSLICDVTYAKGPRLWNELINRRELSSQGAKARRDLIGALINNAEKERLGINGYGPEYSMYESLIKGTGIHKSNEDVWTIEQPSKNSGIYDTWKAIEKFCISATNGSRNINELYELIEKPPYGVKKGITPVLLLAVLLHHSEYLSIYMDGAYVPILATEHFDLLVKQPGRFAVKYFEITGLKAQIFKELEEVVAASSPSKKNIRNATVLSIVNPLIRFIRSLPQYTLQTQNVSKVSIAVRTSLLEAKDPDELLFTALPQACGFSFVDLNSSDNAAHIKIFRKKIVQALQELQAAYGQILFKCIAQTGQLFSSGSELKELRSYLRAIAIRVNANTQVIELNLKRFIKSLIDDQSDDTIWFEALLMVIADKPAKSWTDNDVLVFEVKLSEIVRRFKNLEAIIELKGEVHEGFDARKITVTYPNGKEINEVVWLDQKDKEEVRHIADKVFNDLLSNSDKINKAILSAIIERIFEKDDLKKNEQLIENKKHGR